MYLRVLMINSVLNANHKTLNGRIDQGDNPSYSWNIPLAIQKLVGVRLILDRERYRSQQIKSVYSARDSKGSRQYEKGYLRGDLLNGEARAVIDAEFEEIRTGEQKRSFTQLIKQAFQWIKQRLRHQRQYDQS